MARGGGVEKAIENTHRHHYYPYKYVEDAKLRRIKDLRELKCNTYEQFRTERNKFNPNQHDGHYYCTHVEWIMYLQPDSIFDGLCRECFDKHYDTDFYMLLITHKSDHSKLKRIEAILASGKVVILWSDA
jgi:hypothetical protein